MRKEDRRNRGRDNEENDEEKWEEIRKRNWRKCRIEKMRKRGRTI